MGQSCQTCVATNIEFISSKNIHNENLHLRLTTLRSELIKDTSINQKLNQYRINQNTTFLGTLNQKGLRQGYGELKHKDKFYAGQFLNGLPHGKGLIVDNQYFFAGEFIAGKPHGMGKEKNKQLQFSGEFINGHRYKGRLSHPQYQYQGNFHNNLFDGKGKITYTFHYVTYHGQFKNGKFHGQGKITFRDKYQYQGQFKQGKYHGKGLMLSTCGQIFQGFFQNGTKNGKGWLKTTDGHEVFAEWKDCDLHGKGIIMVQGQKVNVEWSQNKLQNE